MASREELLIIRAARAGHASAQLHLGQRYLFGSAGLPRSLPTALYWLERAAQQDQADAWMLIGSHVPYEIVQQATQPSKHCIWYERAYDAGVAQAGLVWARLTLEQSTGAICEANRNKALRALQSAAHAGIADAQWLLAQHMGRDDSGSLAGIPPPGADDMLLKTSSVLRIDNEAMLEWATRAAQSGVAQAQYALADHAWATHDKALFLRWALPLARRIADCSDGHGQPARPPREHEITLLARCGRALFENGEYDAQDVVRFSECAARAGNRDAQFFMGLWFARMDASGRRVAGNPGLANYKKSTRWLLMAAEQGLAEAWYALSKIYLKPECSQRSLADAHRYLERAAQAGHGPAQLELGVAIWRTRRGKESKDLGAVYWLQKAAAHGVPHAHRLLDRIAPPTAPAEWAKAWLQRLPRESAAMYPFLVARIELAAVFGLSRTEALLLDPKAADCGHCLLVDIRAQHQRSKRRLISLRSAEDRQALDRAVRLFEQVDGGPDGPEGNYRQRLYRLKMLTPE